MPNNDPIEPLRTSALFDVGKIPCKQHPGQTVINFCLNPQCMIGLCSNCICTHTDMHVKNRTAPQYQSIKELKANVITQMTQYLKIYGQSKQKISNLICNVQIVKKQMKDLILIAKQDAYDVVDRCFDNLNKQFEEDIEKRRKIAGILTIPQLESLSKKISKKMREILEQGQQMNSMMRFVDTARKFKIEGSLDYDRFKKCINAQIQNNQTFNCDLRYSKQRLHDIELNIKKMFTLQFQYAKAPSKTPPRSNSPLSLNNSLPISTINGSNILKNASFMINNNGYNNQRPSSLMKTSVRSSTNAIPSYFLNNIQKQEPNNKNHRFSQITVNHNRQPSDLSNSTVINANMTQTMPIDENGELYLNVRNVLNMNQAKNSGSTFKNGNKFSGIRLSNSLTSSQLKDFFKASMKENADY